MLNWFGRKLQEAQKEEAGFTLIELLVVVIIIGILAAIAIPAFLNQRSKAGDSSAQSSLRNAATAQESYQVTNETYAPDEAALKGQGWKSSDGVAFNVVKKTDNSYCMSAKHTNSTKTWWLTTDNGAAVDSKPAGAICT